MSPEGLIFIPDIIFVIAASFSAAKAAIFESAAIACVVAMVTSAATVNRTQLRQRIGIWICMVSTFYG